MKAIVYTQYGPPEVLRLAGSPKPAPLDHEVLVKVLDTNATIGNTIYESRSYLEHRAQERQSPASCSLSHMQTQLHPATGPKLS